MGKAVVSYLCHLYSSVYGGFYAGWVCEVLAGDVESGSVSGGCSDYRQAYGNIHGVFERQQFYGYHALVMVHCNDGVELTFYGL